MALERDGWVEGRPYTAIREPDRGRVLKYVCLDCGGETPPDVAAFEGHNCENYRERGLQVDTSGYEEIDATDAALDRAVEVGVDITDIEGTGTDGRVVKSDVTAAVEDGEE